MSYDIGLYDREFLKRAVEANLGDWTGADGISEEAVQLLITAAVAKGFKAVSLDEQFVAFLREQGAVPHREFELDTPSLLAQLTIHTGEIGFSIPFGPRAAESIDICSRIARNVASESGLGIYDAQVGAAEY